VRQSQVEFVEQVVALLRQYLNDMRVPLTDAERGRRVSVIEAVMFEIEGRLDKARAGGYDATR